MHFGVLLSLRQPGCVQVRLLDLAQHVRLATHPAQLARVLMQIAGADVGGFCGDAPTLESLSTGFS